MIETTITIGLALFCGIACALYCAELYRMEVENARCKKSNTIKNDSSSL